MGKKFLALWLFICVVVFIGLLVIALLLTHRKPADITADYGNHSSGVAVPANFFGTSGVGGTVSSQSGIDNITNVHLFGNRIWAYMDRVYAHGDTPDYSLLDDQLRRGSQHGLQLEMTLYGTPPSLAASNCAMPSDLRKWSQLAAAVVKHIDAQYPGLYWELWNEPDINGMCNSSDQLNDYLNLYATFGPYFRKAAPTAKLGGPALASSGNTATWMPALLSGRTAPFVDFATIHIYITGTWLLPGMTWEQAYQTTQQEPNGLAYYYRLFEQQVRAGHQPNAASTPIGVSEYNTNYAFQPNDVQNTPVYGPLWNTVAVSDFLNVIAKGSRPPAFLNYFMAGYSTGYFCLEGVEGGDVRMCMPPSDGQPYNAHYVPYPTLRAYELFCSPNYLNLEPGFTVVNPPSAPSGLLTLALYTSSADSLVVINPTGAAVSGLRIKLAHLGFKATQGQTFTLANASIASSDLRVRGRDEVTATVDVPAYSTVAVTARP